METFMFILKVLGICLLIFIFVCSLFEFKFYVRFLNKTINRVKNNSSKINEKRKNLIVPEKGKWIKITWLPNPINHPYTKSCFIGTKGIVKEVYPDGGFDLIMNGDGGTLFVGTGARKPDYRFEYIEK